MPSASRSPMRYPLRHGATCWSLCASAMLSQRRRPRAFSITPRSMSPRQGTAIHELRAPVLTQRPPLNEAREPCKSSGRVSGPPGAPPYLPRAGQSTPALFLPAPFLPARPRLPALSASRFRRPGPAPVMQAPGRPLRG